MADSTSQTTVLSQVQKEQAAMPSINLDQLINIALEQDASSIHFKTGGRVALRVSGKFVFVENITSLSETDVQLMVDQMLQDEVLQKRLKTLRELDFSYLHDGQVNFRVNVFFAQGQLSVVMRMVAKHIPTMEELGIPEILKSFLSLREGLILVTGATGSGKSTSIQSMLNYINQNFAHHIITIENPIEYIFREQQSIFSQREIGKDTLNFVNAIRSASREDPDIVMVSEVRDRETLNAVLELAEMGHLVIASMTSRNVQQTLEHLMAMYEKEDQHLMLDRLADTIALIMSQDLLDRVDQPGRVAIFEMLVGTNAAKNVIRRGMLSQLRTVMESEAGRGMVTMDQYASQLLQKNIISAEDAQRYLAVN